MLNMRNDDNEIMHSAAILSEKMSEMLLKKLKNKNSEDRFKLIVSTISSFAGGFIDAVVDNDAPNVKLDLLNEILHITRMVLIAKEKMRECNSSDLH